MKALLLSVFFGLMATAMLLPLGADLVRAQAPSGPQGGSQGTGAQQTPPPAATTTAPPQQKPQDAGASIAVEVPVVTLDVLATTKNGDLLTGLKKENFRVIDDGAPQTITNFGATDAPITIVMLMEFSSRGYYDWFAYQAKYWADAFF